MTNLNSTNQEPIKEFNEPSDSPRPLTQSELDAIRDGISDQQSRRTSRPKVLYAAFSVIFFTMVFLGCTVATICYCFYQITNPDNIEKYVSKKSIHSTSESTQIVKIDRSASASAGASASASASKVSNMSLTKEPSKVESTLAQNTPQIHVEIRDAIVPLVAMVSILTVAVVVTLGTILKAVFAHPPEHKKDSSDDKTISIPFLEALKSLVESIKGFIKDK